LPKRPPIPVTPHEPLDDAFLKESIKELTALISSEWVDEVESSYEEIQIQTPSLPIQCKVARIMVDLLYNPIVGANLMSASFAHTYLGDEALAPTSKHFRVGPLLSLKGLGILHKITVHHNNVEMALDFHVFEI